MASYSTNQFKPGLKIIIDGDPYTMLDSEFVKPGKGQAFNRVKLKNLKTSRVLEKTYKSGEQVTAADVIDMEMQYLYNDGSHWYFMAQDTYEQYEIDASILTDVKSWLKGEEICIVTLWNSVPLSVLPPNFVTLAIAETEPGVRGDTASGAVKLATLETGAEVKVPLFIESDELVKIDTRTGEYIGRAKSD